MIKKVFTPTQALAYIVIELEDILGKYRRTFNKPVNSRLNRMMDHVLKSTNDEAFLAWYQCNGIRSYSGKMSTQEVLGPYLQRCRQFLARGSVPVGATEAKIENILDLDWWEPREITVTETLPDGGKRGTATVLEVEGLYKLQLNWEMVVGEEAEAVGLPAMLNITGATMRLPQTFTLFDADDRPINLLAVVQELDFMHGFSCTILNQVFKGS